MQNCGQVSGQVYYCKGNSCTQSGTVWGGNSYYTSDSNKCRAARHHGVVGSTGNYFGIEPQPGQSSYTGSTKNGITTTSYGAFGGSYQIRQLTELEKSIYSEKKCQKCSKSISGILTFNRGGSLTGTQLGLSCYFESQGTKSWVNFYCDECYPLIKACSQEEYNTQVIKAQELLNTEKKNHQIMIEEMQTKYESQITELNQNIKQKEEQLATQKSNIKQLEEQILKDKSLIQNKNSLIVELQKNIDEQQQFFLKKIENLIKKIDQDNPSSSIENNWQQTESEIKNEIQQFKQKNPLTDLLDFEEALLFSNTSTSVSQLYGIEGNINKYRSDLLSSLCQYGISFMQFQQYYPVKENLEKINEKHDDFFKNLTSNLNQHFQIITQLCEEINQKKIEEIKQKEASIEEFYQQAKLLSEKNNFNEDVKSQILALIQKQGQSQIRQDNEIVQFKQNIEKLWSPIKTPS